MNIGETAAASGVSAKMIRYYERVGLVRAVARKQSNYRDFSLRDVNELRFIKLTRDLGFSVQEIVILLSLWRDPGRTGDEVKGIADAYVARLEDRAAAAYLVVESLRILSISTDSDQRPDYPTFPETVE